MIWRVVIFIFTFCLISACNKEPQQTLDADPDGSHTDSDTPDSDQDTPDTDADTDPLDSDPDDDDADSINCEEQTVCLNGDGCCPDGCTPETDEDCACDYTIDLTPPAVFLSTFESGTVTPEIEDRGSVPVIDARDGGAMNAITNPHPDFCNSSSYVLEGRSPAGYTRAEYQSPRLPTLEHSYIYTWREYIPEDFFDDIHLSWMLRAQWKTWPCGRGQPIDVSDELCGGGGIFNDFAIDGHLGTFTFRTRPDCGLTHIPTGEYLGTWSTYVLEIHWTTSNDGYYRLFRNGRLLAQEEGIKTLYDGFVEGDCDMVFATGLYDTWEMWGEKDLVRAYFDDIAIFDMDDGVDLSDVCPTCEEQTEIDPSVVCAFDDFLPIVDDELIISNFEDPCDWNIGTLESEERMEGDTSLRWEHGFDGWLELTLPNYSTVMDLSHGDYLSFWVHNNIEEPDNSAVLLIYSENESTDGNDYYLVTIDFDFTGWQQMVIAREDINASRTPRGWDQIDSVLIRTSGWDCVRNPDRVLHLDEMKFTNNP